MDETRVPERSGEEAFPGIRADASPDDGVPDYRRPDFIFREIFMWTPLEKKIAGILAGVAWFLFFRAFLTGAARSYAALKLVFSALGVLVAYPTIRRGVPNLWRKGGRRYRIIAVVFLAMSIVIILFVVSSVIDLLGI